MDEEPSKRVSLLYLLRRVCVCMYKCVCVCYFQTFMYECICCYAKDCAFPVKPALEEVDLAHVDMHFFLTNQGENISEFSEHQASRNHSCVSPFRLLLQFLIECPNNMLQFIPIIDIIQN